MLPCPDCTGKGFLMSLGNRLVKGSYLATVPCSRCHGDGYISVEHHEWIQQGRSLRESRVSRGLSQRQEANRRGLKLRTYSLMEQGLISPLARRRQGVA